MSPPRSTIVMFFHCYRILTTKFIGKCYSDVPGSHWWSWIWAAVVSSVWLCHLNWSTAISSSSVRRPPTKQGLCLALLRGSGSTLPPTTPKSHSSRYLQQTKICTYCIPMYHHSARHSTVRKISTSNIGTLKASVTVTSHPGQLNLAIPSWVGAMSTSQRAVMPCGWGVKAGMVRVWVAGKTVVKHR